MSVVVVDKTVATITFKSGEWWLIYSPYLPRPTPPSPEEIKQHFITDGNLDSAIGRFVVHLVDNGYAVTILGYDVVCSTTFLRTDILPGIPPYLRDLYETSISLQIHFTTFPDVWASPIAPLVILAIGFMIAIILAGVGVFFALQNLTKQTETYENIEQVTNNSDVFIDFTLKDGTIVTIPPRASYSYTIKKEITGPPDWWGPIIAIVGVTSVIVVALVALPKVLDLLGRGSQESYLPPPPSY